MRVERSGPMIRPRRLANHWREEPVSEAKPYNITKQLVWKAYRQVKANRGAAGVEWAIAGGVRGKSGGQPL